jgi:hypothetical protein
LPSPKGVINKGKNVFLLPHFMNPQIEESNDDEQEEDENKAETVFINQGTVT